MGQKIEKTSPIIKKSCFVLADSDGSLESIASDLEQLGENNNDSSTKTNGRKTSTKSITVASSWYKGFRKTDRENIGDDFDNNKNDVCVARLPNLHKDHSRLLEMQWHDACLSYHQSMGAEYVFFFCIDTLPFSPFYFVNMFRENSNNNAAGGGGGDGKSWRNNGEFESILGKHEKNHANLPQQNWIHGFLKHLGTRALTEAGYKTNIGAFQFGEVRVAEPAHQIIDDDFGSSGEEKQNDTRPVFLKHTWMNVPPTVPEAWDRDVHDLDNPDAFVPMSQFSYEKELVSHILNARDRAKDISTLNSTRIIRQKREQTINNMHYTMRQARSFFSVSRAEAAVETIGSIFSMRTSNGWVSGSRVFVESH